VGLFIGSEEHSSKMPCTKAEGGGAHKGDSGTCGQPWRGIPLDGRLKPIGGNGKCYEENASRSSGSNRTTTVKTPKPDVGTETEHPPPLPPHQTHPQAPNHITQPPRLPDPPATPKPGADSLEGQPQPQPPPALTPPALTPPALTPTHRPPNPSTPKMVTRSTTTTTTTPPTCAPYSKTWIERSAQTAGSSNKSTT